MNAATKAKDAPPRHQDTKKEREGKREEKKPSEAGLCFLTWSLPWCLCVLVVTFLVFVFLYSILAVRT
jgi:hypothetical protein